jgi:multidrug resistance efflux pump
MKETGNNGPVKSGTLSDRVRSLRLADTAEQPSAGGIWRWLPWIVCALLLCATGLLAMEALSPIDDELIKKLAEERGLSVGKGSVNTVASLSGLGVASSSADKSPVEIALEAKGNIVPFSLIQVSPKITGTVLELDIEEGKFVSEGFLLAVIEDIEFKSDLDHAIAAKKSAEGRLGELQKFLGDEIEQTFVDWKDTVAQREPALAKYERAKKLQQQAGAISVEDFEAAKSGYESLDFRCRRLELAYKMMKDDGNGPRYEKIASARGDLAQAEADFVKAKWRWDNTRVKSPIAGIILSKKTEKGNIVNPSAFSNGLSASLCEMADLYNLEVDLSIAERDIAKVFKDQECRIRPEAYSNRVYKGYVSRIMPMADRSKASVTVRVKVEFPAVDSKGQTLPKDAQGEFLRPEMGAIVTFLNRKK